MPLVKQYSRAFRYNLLYNTDQNDISLDAVESNRVLILVVLALDDHIRQYPDLERQIRGYVGALLECNTLYTYFAATELSVLT